MARVKWTVINKPWNLPKQNLRSEQPEFWEDLHFRQDFVLQTHFCTEWSYYGQKDMTEDSLELGEFFLPPEFLEVFWEC